MNNIIVKDIYENAKGRNIPLLSSYPSNFWNEYRNNFARYDKLFARLYKSFRPFEQEENVRETTDNFIAEVYNHLLINDKKYNELYRIYVVTDTENPLSKDYTMTETMDRDISDNTGERTDTEQHNIGSRSDTYSDTEGARTDTTSATIGSHTDSTNTSKGARTDTGSTSLGSQTNQNTATVSPFDSELFFNDNNLAQTIGARTDGTSFTKGAETDTESTTVGEQSNSGSNVKGAETDTGTKTYGAQENTSTYKVGSHRYTRNDNYTLTKEGSVNRSPLDNINKQKVFWSAYEFYSYIFEEISEELLLV